MDVHLVATPRVDAGIRRDVTAVVARHLVVVPHDSALVDPPGWRIGAIHPRPFASAVTSVQVPLDFARATHDAGEQNRSVSEAHDAVSVGADQRVPPSVLVTVNARARRPARATHETQVVGPLQLAESTCSPAGIVRGTGVPQLSPPLVVSE